MTYDLGIIKRQRYLPQPPTGGTIINYVQSSTNYTAHVFYNSDQLVLPAIITTFDYFLVGAGGGGGAGLGLDGGGGGGAGGVLTRTGVANTNSYYTITVGAGGGGGIPASNGTQGGNSSITGTGFNPIPAYGGGGGGYYTQAASAGASGGGGTAAAKTAGTGIAGQGSNGGNGPSCSSPNTAGGGGGAGAVGGAATYGVTGGVGGAGSSTVFISTATAQALGIGQYVTATNAVYFAGGGGGGVYAYNYPSATAGQGGVGGGGAGAYTKASPVTGTAGTPNTGGGGGGGAGGGVDSNNSNGGSGIVIVRYLANDLYRTYRSQQPDPNFKNTVLLLSNQSLATGVTSPPVLPSSVDYLLVAGGGAGSGAAGGGAGGLLAATGYAITNGTYAVTIGAGGATTAASGSNSVFGAITAWGGGGGTYGVANGGGTGNGGSGGGLSYFGTAGGVGVYPGSTYISAARQGYDGGSGFNASGGTYAGGGGGGAGGIGGTTGVLASGGNGGAGTSTTLISTSTAVSLGVGQVVGSSVYFAGGGAGAGASNSGIGGSGGGASASTTIANSGVAFTGGGGAGGNSGGPGLGGSGVAIIRYPSTYASASSTTGNPKYSNASGYITYVFTASGSLSFCGAAPTYGPSAVEYLVVAGGGAGGFGRGGGGGAGGLKTATGYTVAGGTYLVTVGAGGVANTVAAAPVPGANSVFDTIISTGGGGGVSADITASTNINGGSGGGAAGQFVLTGGTGIAGQGFAGGAATYSAPYYGSGGGGGYSSVGGSGSSTVAGNGGTGFTSTITGSSVGYAGGGGGGTYGGGTAGTATQGGGNGSTTGVGTAGTPNTGGGGGGGGHSSVDVAGGNGGSGVVVVRYANTYSAAASTTGNPVYANTGGYITYVFTASGSIVLPAPQPVTPIANNNTFTDSSVNSVTVTPVGTPAQGSFSPFGQQWSTAFNGVNDYFSLTPVNTSTFTFGTNNFTIELWINVTVLRNQVLLDFRPLATNSTSYMHLLTDATGLVRLYVNNTNKVYSVNPITANTWHHIAVVKSSGIISMFVDGVNANSVADVNSYAVGAARPVVGAASAASLGLTPFIGFISNLRILNGTALYTNNFTPPTAPLAVIPNTVLLTCASPYQFQDSSGLLTTATPGASSVLASSKFSPFKRSYAYNTSLTGGSAYFNGTTDYLTIPYNISTVQWWDTDYTIELWINSPAHSQATSNGNPLQVNYGDPATSSTYWAFGTNAAGKLYFYYYNGSIVTTAISTALVPLNSWNHLAMVYTNSTSTLNGYINGVQVFSVAKSGTPQSPSGYTLNIGSSEAVRYKGYISNVRIVRGTAVYNTNFTPSPVPLTTIDATASTSLLLNFIGANIFDATGLNDIITMNTASLSSTVVNYNNRSMSFNGIGDYLRVPTGTVSTLTTSSLTLGLGDFTIESWVYPTSTQTSTLIDFRPVGTNGIYPTIGLTTGTVVFSVNNAVQISGSVLTVNSWTHLALCRASSTSTMYINGILTGSTYADTNNYRYTSTVTVAAQSLSLGATPFAGYLDDLRITNGVARYLNNFQPPQFKPPLK